MEYSDIDPLTVSELPSTPESIERFRNIGTLLNQDAPRWSQPADPPMREDVTLVAIGTAKNDVGRVALLNNPAISIDGEPIALLGWYECTDHEPAAQQLLSAAVSIADRRGFRRIIGPIDGSTWHRYRFSDPSDGTAFTLDIENAPWYVAQWERSGFHTLATYHSRMVDLHPKDYSRVEAFELRFNQRGVRVREFNRDCADQDLAMMYQISLEAFRSNLFFSPISFAEFQGMYNGILPYIDTRLVLIAEDADGKGLAYLFAFGNRIPGYEDIVVVKTVASLPMPSARGVGTLLAEKAHLIAHHLGFRRAVHALMHDTNASTNIAAAGSERIRSYRLFWREV